MFVRQLPAAWTRSASVQFTCTSLSASAKVVGETSGPEGGAVPRAGGVPGGTPPEVGDLPPHSADAPNNANDECVRKFLREFDISPPNRIVGHVPSPNCRQFALIFELSRNRVGRKERSVEENQ